jgi:predicted metal-dependent hydrolase
MARSPRRPDPAQLSLFVAPEPTASAVMRTDAVTNEAPAPAIDADALSPAVFRHPQGSREIVLGGHTVGYALKRARRRSIGFIVGIDGLSVNAPGWVGVRDIESALREKATWILGKLHEQRQRGRRLQSARVDWRDGVTIPFLGQAVIVVLDSRAGVTPAAMLDAEAPGLAAPRRLHIGLPPSALPEQIRDAVQSWLQRQAKRVFAERCDAYAAQLGVRYRRLSLSSAQTRWGSASADGSIRLSWRLIHFGLATIDYVVAHELAHLREMNHSPRFWDVVRSVVPDYERTRLALKTDVLPVFD